MNKTYDFDWMIREIDNSMVLALIKDNKVVSSYQICYILTGDMRQIEVKFANISDLDNFVNYAVARFYDILNKNNIIDIPIRKLKELYENSNNIDNIGNRKRIELASLDAFSVLDGKPIGKEYSIEAIKFQDISSEFQEIINICSKYGKMDLMEKFEALESVNVTNYRVDKESASK